MNECVVECKRSLMKANERSMQKPNAERAQMLQDEGERSISRRDYLNKI